MMSRIIRVLSICFLVSVYFGTSTLAREVPKELLPDDSFCEKTLTNEIRQWTDDFGRTIVASLSHISENGKKLWLRQSNSTETYAYFDRLSVSDQEYISSLVSSFIKKGRKWYRGTYLSEQEIRDIDNGREIRENAKRIMREKDESVSGIRSLTVFRRWSEGYICTAWGRAYLFISGKKYAAYADGDSIEGERFYWAGVQSFECKDDQDRNVVRTVTVLTDDVEIGIRLVSSSCCDLDADPKGKKSLDSSKEGSGAQEKLFASGSGFCVSSDGYFVTNYHVIEGAKSVKILLLDGLVGTQIVATDPINDLALLKVVGKSGICSTVISSKKVEKLGTDIFTLGFPQPDLQGFSPKVTKGVISGVDGFKGDIRLYQIDASIQPGNSGGALFDMNGNVTGIVVASLKTGQVVNYVIKKSYLCAFLDSAGCCWKASASSHENADMATLVEKLKPACGLVLAYQD